MKKIKEIEPNELDLTFVYDYYDMPLNGLCDFMKSTCYFEFNQNDKYTIYKLNIFEKIKWMLDKFMFEKMVGKHWSYKKGAKIQKNYKTNELFDTYYKIKDFFK